MSVTDEDEQDEEQEDEDAEVASDDGGPDDEVTSLDGAGSACESESEVGDGGTRPKDGSRVSLQEKKIYELHQAEKQRFSGVKSRLVRNLPRLFGHLPGDAVPRVRAALDAGLVFRRNGSAADLRTVVFEWLSDEDRKTVLRAIQRSCSRPPPRRPGFVVLSDVDDTLLPAGDRLKVAGCDRSVPRDGRLYPGVSRLHLELRNCLREDYGGDYSVLLTARPPSLVRSLTKKLKRICGVRSPRMAILPGQEGAKAGVNMFRILAGSYSTLGQTKVTRMQEYSLLFPEYQGRFVFIGDDGQADVQAAEEMLGLRSISLGAADGSVAAGELGEPLMAFVAVHAVQPGWAHAVPDADRAALTERIRARFPPLPGVVGAPLLADGAATRHRFFYFVDYSDLAHQLVAAGWIDAGQRDSILRAVDRDRLHLAECVDSCDLRGVRRGLSVWAEAIDEADETEQEVFARAGAELPALLRVHVILGFPPEKTTSIGLQLLHVTTAANSDLNFEWPGIGIDTIPVLTLQDVASGSAAQASKEDGLLKLPWPSADSRRAIDVQCAHGALGRCFVMIEDSACAMRHGNMAMVALVATQRGRPLLDQLTGELTLAVKWIAE